MLNKQTPFHRRRAARLAKAKEKRERDAWVRYIEIDRFMLCFEQAYRDLYRQPVQVRYHSGWYYVFGHRYRHSAMQRWIEKMQAEYQEQLLNGEEK